jgi:type III restriction enzyme
MPPHTSSFTGDTPVVPYNPDWAIVFEQSKWSYLVRETQGNLKAEQRRHDEDVKVECAQRHFKAIDVDYSGSRVSPR